jgi:hypothetical protein
LSVDLDRDIFPITGYGTVGVSNFIVRSLLNNTSSEEMEVNRDMKSY